MVVINATVTEILPRRSGVAKSSGKPWAAGGIVVSYNDRVPRTLAIEVFGEKKLALLDDISPDDPVVVAFTLESKEYHTADGERHFSTSCHLISLRHADAVTRKQQNNNTDDMSRSVVLKDFGALRNLIDSDTRVGIFSKKFRTYLCDAKAQPLLFNGKTFVTPDEARGKKGFKPIAYVPRHLRDEFDNWITYKERTKDDGRTFLKRVRILPQHLLTNKELTFWAEIEEALMEVSIYGFHLKERMLTPQRVMELALVRGLSIHTIEEAQEVARKNTYYVLSYDEDK